MTRGCIHADDNLSGWALIQMPRATHLQTLGDASSYAAFTNKVRIVFSSWSCNSLFLRHDILDPIEGDDWSKVIIIAAAAGTNDSESPP